MAYVDFRKIIAVYIYILGYDIDSKCVAVFLDSKYIPLLDLKIIPNI